MNNRQMWAWTPAVLLLLGACATYGGVREQLSVELRAPLDTSVPRVIEGFHAEDIPISESEQAVAGMDNYVMRVYGPEGSILPAEAFSIYVGYYASQSQGNTIHSPKNCLPGGGWEPLVSSREVIATPNGAVPVNRYLIGNGAAKALVLYWYQGRGRVAANEYTVKWDLLRDQALKGRSDEALVRIIVPVEGNEQEAYELATEVAQTLVPSVYQALPA